MTEGDAQDAAGTKPDLPPQRFSNLPAPPPLPGSKEEQKQRIKEAEAKLKDHRSKKIQLAEGEVQELTRDLQELRKALTKGDSENPGKVEDEADVNGEGKGDASRRLALKREIREIEKQLKSHKKKPCLDKRQLSELEGRLEALKVELTRKPSVLSLRFCEAGAGAPAATVPAVPLALEDRISIAGLSNRDASMLRTGLKGPASSSQEEDAWEEGPWEFRRHTGLQTAALFGRDGASIGRELEHIASFSPHVICVGTASLQASRGLCAVLRDFRGALILIEEEPNCPEKDLVEIACLLPVMGVRARWTVRPGLPGLEPAEVPRPLQSQVIGDLKLRDLKENLALEPVFAEADELCIREFEEDLREVLASDSARLGLLLSAPQAAAEAGADDGPKREERPDFYGFITYKFWTPPLKAMSITRVAVPRKYQMQGFGRLLVRWAIDKAKQKPRHECEKVSLCAIPKAIAFYKHLNFSVVVDDDQEAPDEDEPKPAGSLRMEFSLGRR